VKIASDIQESGDKPIVVAVDDVCSFKFDFTNLLQSSAKSLRAPPRPPPKPKNNVIVSLPKNKETMARHIVR
jgi:hypothetical protein